MGLAKQQWDIVKPLIGDPPRLHPFFHSIIDARRTQYADGFSLHDRPHPCYKSGVGEDFPRGWILALPLSAGAGGSARIPRCPPVHVPFS